MEPGLRRPPILEQQANLIRNAIRNAGSNASDTLLEFGTTLRLQALRLAQLRDRVQLQPQGTGFAGQLFVCGGIADLHPAAQDAVEGLWLKIAPGDPAGGSLVRARLDSNKARVHGNDRANDDLASDELVRLRVQRGGKQKG
ncbi:MAG: hypothetical protein AB8H80_10245 [Planctomycetota bacterium]